MISRVGVGTPNVSRVRQRVLCGLVSFLCALLWGQHGRAQAAPPAPSASVEPSKKEAAPKGQQPAAAKTAAPNEKAPSPDDSTPPPDKAGSDAAPPVKISGVAPRDVVRGSRVTISGEGLPTK